MDAHIIGQGQFSDENFSPAPAHGTSVAVAQWIEVIRGERQVHQPANPFRTLQIVEEERYCMECCGVRWHDVLDGVATGSIHGGVVTHNYFQVSRCRACGHEVHPSDQKGRNV